MAVRIADSLLIRAIAGPVLSFSVTRSLFAASWSKNAASLVGLSAAGAGIDVRAARSARASPLDSLGDSSGPGAGPFPSVGPAAPAPVVTPSALRRCLLLGVVGDPPKILPLLNDLGASAGPGVPTVKSGLMRGGMIASYEMRYRCQHLLEIWSKHTK
jgi:hypothetical protein